MFDTPDQLAIGEKAPAFTDLKGVDGNDYSLDSFQGETLLVVIFSCNGCPTVKANEERLVELQNKYGGQGVQLIAINSNNAYLSPADTFPEMVRRAREKRFNFPYVKDEDGSVARDFGAVSTPHVFVLDGARVLRYRGRIDDTRDPRNATHSDLEYALSDLLASREVRVPDTKPFGCAIVR